MNNKKIVCLPVLCFVFVILSSAFSFIYAQSGVYDRIGIIPEHGYHGAIPEENIDLFTGNLTLRFLDVYLPGPNGFDLKVWRVYNSKVLRDRLSGGLWGVQQEPYSWVGLGWSMHMGRVHAYNFDTPVIEFPDGRMETAYLTSDGDSCMTRDFVKYVKSEDKVYFRDGTVWTLGAVKTITYEGPFTEQVQVVTLITNSFGHQINVEYPTGSTPNMNKITDSMGREVTFVATTGTYPKLQKIQVKTYNGATAEYLYDVNTFTGGYYRLDSYDPPLLSASTFEYYSGQNTHYELTRLTTSYGGEISYAYNDHTFYFYNYPLDTRVVTQKDVKYNSSSSNLTWTYTYPSYQTSSSRTVAIDGPTYDWHATYHRYESTAPWAIGLIESKSFDDGSFSEDFDWTPQTISNIHWFVLSTDMGPAAAPLISSDSKSKAGDSESDDNYYYERAGVKKYGLPTKIEYYAEGSRKSYRTLEYFFEGNSSYENKYMVSYVSDETHFSNGGAKLNETQTSYYTVDGKWGAIDWLKKWVSGSTYRTWDHTYISSNPNSITIDIDLPGINAGTETYIYSYGVLSRIDRPGYTELSRTISQYDSSILTETNQHVGTMSFTYDTLGRITAINMPTGFNDIGASWNTTYTNNYVTITQGVSPNVNTVIKHWDGLGRDLGYTESGDSVTLFFRKTLDDEGRVVQESKGSTNSSHVYTYELSALGLKSKITDPRGKITNIINTVDKRTATDPENHVTESTYADLPGLVTSFKDAASRYAYYTYDGLGRMTGATYHVSGTQSYSYDGLNNVTSETHPETGNITYEYSGENNLWHKNWGGTQITYGYNTSNQITTIGSGDETVTYIYDSHGRVGSVSSTKNWSRDNILYNAFGSITQERITIPGLTAKTITYGHDGNNNLNAVTYPDGKQASFSNNGLNVPETASFNSKSLISQAAYGIVKKPTSLTISGNTTAFTALYDSVGGISSASLTKSGTTLYGGTYGYDGVGNIQTISSTTPPMNATLVYDSLYRLQTATYNAGAHLSYGFVYDEYGNLKTATADGNPVFSVNFNSQNRINGYSYDNRGNLTFAVPFSYTWDNMNRLAETKNGGITDGSYLYDDRGFRMMASRVPPGAPSITILSPNGEERWTQGTQREITWSSTSVGSTVKIEYTADRGKTYTVITSGTENDGSYMWTVPSLVSEFCRIKVSDVDGDPFDVSDEVFIIRSINSSVIRVDAEALFFGSSVGSGATTSAQALSIRNDGEGSLNWRIVSDTPWLAYSPASGADSGLVSVSANPAGLAPGTYIGKIYIYDPLASNNPREVEVQLTVHKASLAPIGQMELPREMEILKSSISISGWAIDDVEVDRVEIRRSAVTADDPKNIGEDGLVYIGNAVIADGARPDVEEVFYGIPGATRAGWGYSFQTYTLPDRGMSGEYTIHAIAYDKEGNKSELGKRRIFCDNAHNMDLFGSFELPGEGERAQGNAYVCKGWALSAASEDKLHDRSAIRIWVDGVDVGEMGSGFYQEDLARAFKEYPNSNSAAHIFCLDTTKYADGMHSIALVNDRAGEGQVLTGIRAFCIKNSETAGLGRSEAEMTGGARQAAVSKTSHISEEEITYARLSDENILLSTGFAENGAVSRCSPDSVGDIIIALKGMDRLEIRLVPASGELKMDTSYSGFLQVGSTFRPLPFGSTLDTEKGVFSWMVHPVFHGEYELVFTENEAGKPVAKKVVRVTIGKEGDYSENSLEAYLSGSGFRGENRSVSQALTGVQSYAQLAADATATLRRESFTKRASTDALSGDNRASGRNGLDRIATIQTLVNTYYFYSYDGKLLAEYDHTGACVRDYIYFGNMLLAEYLPQQSKYYYYTSDQVNSVRMITDDNGTVVYSAAYAPYGQIQQTWVSTYQPKLQFSGKEREAETGLDYFGARYYANGQYRFISVDPIVNKDVAIYNPQLWNLYAYCRNNPITYMDPDGRSEVEIKITRSESSENATWGKFSITGTDISGATMEPPWNDNIKNKSSIKTDTYAATIERGADKGWDVNPNIDVIRLEDKHGRTGILIHTGSVPKHTKGCIIVGSEADVAGETIKDSGARLKAITDFIRLVQAFDYFVTKESTVIRVKITEPPK